MYDTIKIKQYITSIQYLILLKLLRSLNTVSNREYENTGIITTQTTYKECYFSLSPNHLTISVSLPKLLFGTNQINVTRNDAASAISILQGILDIDISQAKVSRIDIAYNFTMDQPIETYFKLLCSKDKMKRWTVGHESLYFTNKAKGIELNFYNKTAQLKDTKQIVLPENLSKNLLRYEFRLKKQVTKSLGYPEVTCNTLIDEEFYQSAMNL